MALSEIIPVAKAEEVTIPDSISEQAGTTGDDGSEIRKGAKNPKEAFEQGLNRLVNGLLTIAVLQHRVNAVMEGLPCAGIQSTVTHRQEVTLTGYVKREDRQRLESEIIQGGAQQVTVEAELLDSPYCELRQLVDPLLERNRSERYSLRLSTGRAGGRYQEGEPLVLDLSAPGFGARLYVDYFLLDGSVVHLYPSNKAELRPYTPRGRLAIGEGGQNARRWEVSPPFGVEKIVAIASEQPLFDGLRPETERSLEYLPVLRERLARRGRMVADIASIETSPALEGQSR